MGDYLHRAYDEADRAMSRGDSDATRTRQDVADLKAENAKLQEEIEAAKHDLSLFSFELVASKLENAKLRKLVSNCHGWLAVNCEKGYVIPRNGLDAIEQSMRELGIEVDE